MFIRHRTADEIKEAEDTKWEKLRDPQPDSDRVQKPEWLIMLGTPLLINLGRHLELEIAARYNADISATRFRCLHTSRVCSNWRSRRFRRMVLSLPRVTL